MANSTESQEVVPRLWPAWIILATLWASVLIPVRVWSIGDELIYAILFGVMGPLVLFMLWWLFASRIPWRDRLRGVLLFVAGLGLGNAVLFHSSAFTGLAVPMVFLPCVFTAVALAMLLSKRMPWRDARWLVAASFVLSIACWACVRIDGSDGGLLTHLSPRWQPTDEDRFLASRAGQSAKSIKQGSEESAAQLELVEGDWSGFRGPNRDSVTNGHAFNTDWNVYPPEEVWRRRVGPGWSSFAVVQGRLFTQEQRGGMESIVCYNADTGDEIWDAGVPARFYKVESGYGPLATPTFFRGALYTFGATGVVRSLDAATGNLNWQREITKDLPVSKPPDWGFACSPLLVESGDKALVIVYAGNPKPSSKNGDSQDASTIAYDAATGEPVWTAGQGSHAYCSPMLATFSDEQQILLATNAGLESFDPESGKQLWFYEWSTEDFPRIAAPIVVDEQTLILASGYGYGAQSLRITKSDDVWTVGKLWESRSLKPYFNDCVLYEGHVYGYNDKFFTCIDIQTGEPTWQKRTRRKRQFGCGQVLLVKDQGVLLVLTELTGEVVLLEAKPTKLVQIAKFKVLEGKTWNHPVVAHGRLYVRNGAEMACFKLPTLNVAAQDRQGLVVE